MNLSSSFESSDNATLYEMVMLVCEAYYDMFEGKNKPKVQELNLQGES